MVVVANYGEINIIGLFPLAMLMFISVAIPWIIWHWGDFAYGWNRGDKQ